jgi:hypothetical protein
VVEGTAGNGNLKQTSIIKEQDRRQDMRDERQGKRQEMGYGRHKAGGRRQEMGGTREEARDVTSHSGLRPEGLLLVL